MLFDGYRTDILVFLLNQDPNLLRGYVVRPEGTPLLGLLVYSLVQGIFYVLSHLTSFFTKPSSLFIIYLDYNYELIMLSASRKV